MGGDPKDSPMLGIAAAQIGEVGHIAALGVICLLDLFALRAVRVDQLAAGAIHDFSKLLEIGAVGEKAEFVKRGAYKNTINIEVLVLGGDGGPAAGFETMATKSAGGHFDVVNAGVGEDDVAGVRGIRKKLFVFGEVVGGEKALEGGPGGFFVFATGVEGAAPVWFFHGDMAGGVMMGGFKGSAFIFFLFE